MKGKFLIQSKASRLTSGMEENNVSRLAKVSPRRSMELQLDVNSTFVRRRLTEILSGSVLVLRGCLDDRKTFNCLASKGKLRLRSQFVHLHSLEVTDTGTAFFSTTFTAQIHFHNFWPSSRGAFAPFFAIFLTYTAKPANQRVGSKKVDFERETNF